MQYRLDTMDQFFHQLKFRCYRKNKSVYLVLKLNKLICFYDSNGISIDGKIDPWYQDDIALRCQSYGWHVIDNVDGHHRAEINSAIEEAKLSDKPTMIVCKTSIGYGAGDKQDSEASHGLSLIHISEPTRL